MLPCLVPCFFAFSKRCENDLCRAVPISRMCLQASGYCEPADGAVQCYHTLPALAHVSVPRGLLESSSCLDCRLLEHQHDSALSCWIHKVDKIREFCSICTLKVILARKYWCQNWDLCSLSADIYCLPVPQHGAVCFSKPRLCLRVLGEWPRCCGSLNQCPEWSCCL